MDSLAGTNYSSSFALSPPSLWHLSTPLALASVSLVALALTTITFIWTVRSAYRMRRRLIKEDLWEQNEQEGPYHKNSNDCDGIQDKTNINTITTINKFHSNSNDGSKKCSVSDSVSKFGSVQRSFEQNCANFALKPSSTMPNIDDGSSVNTSNVVEDYCARKIAVLTRQNRSASVSSDFRVESLFKYLYQINEPMIEHRWSEGATALRNTRPKRSLLSIWKRGHTKPRSSSQGDTIIAMGQRDIRKKHSEPELIGRESNDVSIKSSTQSCINDCQSGQLKHKSRLKVRRSPTSVTEFGSGALQAILARRGSASSLTSPINALEAKTLRSKANHRREALALPNEQ